jgi:ABC-type transport system involved in multi-copper enzyme maturation permease subunit
VRAIVTIAAFTLLEAVRNRLLWLVVAFLVAGFGLTEFVGEVAITEAREFQSGFLAAFVRGFSVFMISLFVITSVVRELNDKGLEIVLSLPIPRASYFFGKLGGFLLLASITTLLCGLGVLLYAPPGQVLIWSISLWCELGIVIAFSLLCLFTLSHVTLALSVVMAFYVLSRTIGAFQLIGEGPLAATTALSQRFINAFLDGFAFVLPELYNFTLSEWLIYHTARWSDLLPILGQSVIYMALLAGAALFDLYRKNL